MNTQKVIAIILLAVVAYCGCKKSEPTTTPTVTPVVNESYSSLNDFFTKNAPTEQQFTINGATGGSFTGAEGTKVTFPANAFVDGSNTTISGNVTVKLIELYNKSDMFFKQILPDDNFGRPLHSGGEFFIGATFNGSTVALANGKKFIANMPKNANDTLGTPKAFIISPFDSAGTSWDPASSDSLYNATSYIWNGYTFSTTFGDSGVWCNSDQSFNNVNYGTVTIIPAAADSQTVYNTSVFIIFKVKAMMHVYYDDNNNTYPDPYSPLGYDAAVVTVGVKKGILYSSFTPITVSDGLKVNFTMQPTTIAAFKSALNALN